MTSPHISLRGTRAAVVVQSGINGGAEAYLVRLYTHLAALGVHVHILGSLPGWDPRNGSVHELSLSPKWSLKTILSGVFRSPAESKRVSSVIGDIQPDWIHMQFKREQIAFTKRLSRQAPVVWTEHGTFTDTTRALAPVYAHASRRVSRLICVSSPVAQSIMRFNRALSTIVIENAVDQYMHTVPAPSRRREARTLLGLTQDAFVVLWIGRVDPGKLPDVAVHYAKHTRAHTVVMVGAGDQLSEIRQSGDDLENLTITGFVPDPRNHYDAADVLMFTSSGRGEGLPTVLLEAAAHDLPVVTHTGSAAESVVTESGGIVVSDVADHMAWRSALQTAALTRGSTQRAHWTRCHSMYNWTQAHADQFYSLLSQAQTRK